MAVPDHGFLLLKEYGRPFEEQVDESTFDEGFDPMELLAEDRSAGTGVANSSPFEFIQNSRALKLLKAFSQIKDRELQNAVVDLCELIIRQKR